MANASPISFATGMRVECVQRRFVTPIDCSFYQVPLQVARWVLVLGSRVCDVIADEDSIADGINVSDGVSHVHRSTPPGGRANLEVLHTCESIGWRPPKCRYVGNYLNIIAGGGQQKVQTAMCPSMYGAASCSQLSRQNKLELGAWALSLELPLPAPPELRRRSWRILAAM